jgi:hypothetical protein
VTPATWRDDFDLNDAADVVENGITVDAIFEK